MNPDRERLLRFQQHGDQEAFTSLVNQYLPLVHAVALRVTRDPVQVQDISQQVFIRLSRHPADRLPGIALPAWLHTETRTAALMHIRSEFRRKRREEIAISLGTMSNEETQIPWEKISPVIDELISQLPRDQREPLIARFFDGRSHREIAHRLGQSEDACRMRVNRGLEKLRGLLARKGIQTSVAALAATLPGNAIAAPIPSSLASAITTAVFSSEVVPTTSVLLKTISTLIMKKVQIAVVALLVVGTVLIVVPRHESDTKSSTSSVALGWDSARTLAEQDNPGSHSQRRAPAKGKPNRLLASVFDLDVASMKPSRQELEIYLNANQRSAESLIAASELGEDPTLLTEALGSFPNDPHVLTAAASQEADPVKKLDLLQRLAKADPNNGIANALAAKVLLESGKPDEALAELKAMKDKSLEDYSAASIQSKEDAYIAAGRSPIEAKRLAICDNSHPEITQLVGLASSMTEASEAADAAGNPEAADAFKKNQFDLAEEVRDSGSLVRQLSAAGIEMQALDSSNSAEDLARKDEISAQTNAAIEQVRALNELARDHTIPEADWISFFDRMKTFGDSKAIGWMLEKHPSH